MTTQNKTPKDFAPHVLAVLGELTGYTASKAVPMESTYDPVCQRMGLDPDAYGIAMGKNIPMVHRKIQLGMRHLRDKGLTGYASKGQWILTPEGLSSLQEPTKKSESDKTPSPVVENADVSPQQSNPDPPPPTNKPTKMAAKAAVSPTFIHVRNSAYHADPYLRALAIDRTPCFGAYSPTHKACEACPISKYCKEAVGARKAEIAADMLREEEEARAAKEAHRLRKAKQDASIDELIRSQEQPDGRYRPPPGALMANAIADVRTQCAHCKGIVDQGTKAIYVETVGVFHRQCLDLSGRKAPSGS